MYFYILYITYKSNVDDKNIYRTQLVNNILQYGITILAVVIIQVFIMAIIIRNRIDRRLDRLKLLRHMGMTKFMWVNDLLTMAP